MKPEDMLTLSISVDKRVQILTTEGERLEARVIWVDAEHDEVIYDLISTNTPELYERVSNLGEQGSYVIPFAHISEIQICSDS